VLDVFVLELGGEFGGEIIHLHDHSANTRDQKIVTEHCRNRDAESRDGGDERARNAGRHRRQVGRSCYGHIRKSVHHAPDSSEQAEKRRPTHRSGEQNHLRFQLEGGFPDRAFHRGPHRVHLRRRNFLGDTETGAKRFVDFSGAEQMEREFLAAGAVDIENGSAGETRVSFVQPQWLPVLTKGFEKTYRLFSGEPDHAHFCDHHRPTEDRADGEGEEDYFAGNGGVFKSEKEPAAREEFRKQDRGQVEIINNAFREKRKLNPSPAVAGSRDPGKLP